MKFFDSISLAPPDSIFGLNEAFESDPRKEKVNLGVGAYKTFKLEPMVLEAVLKAEQHIIKKSLNKEYLPIQGEREFLAYASELVLGEDIPRHRIFSAQSLGGTGALRVGGQFLVEHVGKSVFLPLPTWDNHARIFSKAGMNVASYPYYSPKKQEIDFPAICQAILHMPAKSVIVFHGSCHNPTGCDPTFEQWKELCALVKKQELLCFFDFAYQGLGEGLSKDAEAIRYFVAQQVECLIAVSFSKNFGLYGERVGLLLFACDNEDAARRVGSQVKVVIRGLYSNPPTHGARIVSTILQNASFTKLWREELTSMRERLQDMRKSLVGMLASAGTDAFQHLEKQKGMFAFTGISQEAVDQLKQTYGIYLPRNGRISLTGLNEKNLPYVVEAILAVTSD